MQKRIFTFWEPADNMPDYIKLCIESWKKFLPDYEIVILNYSNYEQWIGKNFYSPLLFEKFTIPQQTQAIRAAILEKHGGIWFDADVIVTSENALDMFGIDSELIGFEERIPCFKAKTHSKIMKCWVKKIKSRLFKYKLFFNFLFIHFPEEANKMMDWDYFSIILRHYFRTKNNKKYYPLKIDLAYPELIWDKKENHSKYKQALPNGYNWFYIKNDFTDYALEHTSGLIVLHNSWMPKEYKTLSAENILKRKNTLSGIFNKIFNETAKVTI